jgi:hypothetical protein
MPLALEISRQRLPEEETSCSAKKSGSDWTGRSFPPGVTLQRVLL